MNPEPKPKKNVWKKLFIGLLIFLVIAALAGLVYWQYKKAKDLEKTTADLSREIDNLGKSPSPKTSASPSSISNNSGNTGSNSQPCASVLTSADKSEMTGWKTFDNATYKFSFEYSSDFSLLSQEQSDDKSTFFAEYGTTYMTVAAGDAAGKIPPDSTMKLISDKSTKLACTDANEKVYSSNSGQLNVRRISFSKNNTSYLIILSYKSVAGSASLSQPINDNFNLTLRSFQFK